MKLLISLSILLLLNACAKEKKPMLKSDTLLCQSTDAWNANKSNFFLFTSYTSKYGEKQ